MTLLVILQDGVNYYIFVDRVYSINTLLIWFPYDIFYDAITGLHQEWEGIVIITLYSFVVVIGFQDKHLTNVTVYISFV